MVGNIQCVIPVYNNAGSVGDIVSRVKRHNIPVLVVDDGSTDGDLAALFADENGVTVLTHETNSGKGAALASALRYLRKEGVSHMITIDADGQHHPEDIPTFIDAIGADPQAIWVGTRDFDQAEVPSSSRFGRRFSNMWFRIETGKGCLDTQSGFRAYPIDLISQIELRGKQYDFEVEILARAAWAGIPVKDIPVNVHYPAPEERVSHFKPFRDNLTISLMHSRLVGRRLVPLPHKQLLFSASESEGTINYKKYYKKELLRHPGAFLKMLLRENATPMGLALAAAVGSFIAVLPLVGVHTLVILYVAARLHLNKIMAISIQILYSPPFVPFVCLEVGHFMRQGRFLTDFTFSSLTEQITTPWFLVDWLLGSLVMAPFYAVVAYFGVYYIAVNIQNKMALKKEIQES